MDEITADGLQASRNSRAPGMNTRQRRRQTFIAPPANPSFKPEAEATLLFKHLFLAASIPNQCIPATRLPNAIGIRRSTVYPDEPSVGTK